MFDAVIFDWDGTLADTKSVIVISFQKVLKEIGCKVSDEFLEKQIGIGARKMFKTILKTSDIPFDSKIIDSLVEKKNTIQTKLTNRIRLFEGVMDLLDFLQSKVKIALATMSNRKVINKLLTEKGIRKYFDIVITADEVKEPKPNPEIFLKCASILKCHPIKCVVVEDSIFGTIAAKKANMKCIAIPSGAYSIEELKKEDPDLIVKSIREKDKILKYVFCLNN